MSYQSMYHLTTQQILNTNPNPKLISIKPKEKVVEKSKRNLRNGLIFVIKQLSDGLECRF